MTQLEVFTNPLARARRAFPLVVVLQSNIADTGRDRIIAPLAPRARLVGTTGRLTPHVEIGGVEYVILIPRLIAMPAADLRDSKGMVTKYRDQIVAALDYLFLGV